MTADYCARCEWCGRDLDIDHEQVRLESGKVVEFDTGDCDHCHIMVILKVGND